MPTQAELIFIGLKKEGEKRLLDEGIPRIKKCLSKLDETEIWYRPNAETVSIGNLCLHLCGNVRQWLVSGIGGKPDTRNRPLEFSEKGPLPTDYLIEELTKLEQEIKESLEGMKLEDLMKKRSVQIYEEAPLNILIHVIEHFSYHVGQITYAVKSRKNVDMEYYPEID